MAERDTDLIEALGGMIDGALTDVNTAIPGVIVAYANGRARVQPTGKKRYSDGEALDFPVIPDCRVCWPSFDGGTAGMKGPVKPGDKCLIIVAQQSSDSGDDRRKFDLSDSYAIMCDLGNAGAGDSANNDDVTLFYGSAYLRITKAGKVIINAPGGVEIKTPLTTNKGKLLTEGRFTYQMGMTGYGGSGGSTDISGNINHVSGSIRSLGKLIDGNHTHQETNSGNTLPPNG